MMMINEDEVRNLSDPTNEFTSAHGFQDTASCVPGHGTKGGSPKSHPRLERSRPHESVSSSISTTSRLVMQLASNSAPKRPRGHSSPRKDSGEPWVRIHLDSAEPQEGKAFSVIVNAFSRHIDSTSMHSASCSCESFCAISKPKKPSPQSM